MTSILKIIHSLIIAAAGLFGIGFVIGFHELGHFLFCKLFNVETPSFSIGFGPRLITKKIGETEFSLSAIPLGGYVEIAGAVEVGQGEQQKATSTDERSFARKPWYQKMLVMIGGIGFNLIFAYFMLCILFMVGMPKSPLMYPRNATNTIALVAPETPAAQAGITEHDVILSVNDNPITNVSNFIDYIKDNPKTPMTLMVQNGEGTQRTVSLVSADKEVLGKRVGSLGIVFAMKNLEPVPFVDAIRQGITTTNTLIKSTVDAFTHILSKRDVSQVGGPIMIISETMRGAGKGIKVFLLFLAFISVNLAILNLIPVPILDGGQMLFFTIEAIIRRPLPYDIRWYIHITSWIGFMLLALYLSYKDIVRIASPYFEHIAKFFGF